MEPLISVQRLQQLLGGSGVDQAYVDGVSAAIRSYCGWHVAPVVEETLVVDGHGDSILNLPTLRIVSLDRVMVLGLEIPDVEWSQDGILRGYWPDIFRSIEITLTHGFEQADDLVGVAMDVLARAVNSELGGAAETIGPFSFGPSQGGFSFYAHELQVLDRYRLPRLP